MKRVCRFCQSSDNMTKVIDAEYGITSERRIACFKCQPSMDSNDYRHASTTERPLQNETIFDEIDLHSLADLQGIEKDEVA